MRRALASFSLVVPLALAGACGGSGNNAESSSTGGSSSSSSSSSASSSSGAGGSIDPGTFAAVPTSCVYDCPANGTCPEQEGTPYACQNLGPWTAIPHDTACPTWDGTLPKPVTGKCTATAPTGEAIKYAGADPASPSVLILPDGRRLSPAGADFVFPDAASMTANVVPVAGTSLLLTVDLGYTNHIVRAVDPMQIAAQTPTLGQVDFMPPESLNQGIAFSPPDRVFVASAQGVVQALTLDTKTGKLTRNDAGSIKLPASPASPGGVFYASGVAVSADNTKLFASGVKDGTFVVADVTAGGAGYGTIVGQVSLGAIESFDVYVDPHDPTTHFAYVTMWASSKVLEVDVSNPAMPKVSRSFAVEKDPEGLAFLDARWAVTTNDLGDSLSLLDRASGTVTTVAVQTGATLKGFEPSSVAWDAATSRLYVTEAGYNAVAAYHIDLAVTPPMVMPLGRLPTQWWPSGVVVLGDGSLAVTSIMARGAGPRMPSQEYELLHGGIQRIPAPSAADLTAGEAKVAANAAVGQQSGYPTVQCPAGVSDFPIPPTNTGKPSPSIDHVFLVVRENKTFDGLMGDLGGQVKGNAANTMVPSAQMDGIWTNIRKLARTFAHSDNFYTSAFISTQGHLWTTHGRTDDYNEREWWVTGYGRSLRGDSDSGGVIDEGRPSEGSMFDWLGANNLPYDVLGEIVGAPSGSPADGHNPFDSRYPGGIIQNIGHSDVEKACYVAGRARVLCDLGNVVYMTLPNDHTQGASPSAPSPETMFAVNDEATGMLVDAVSHSAWWPKSLVIVVEDDPAQGGESIDYHRTILVMASPWLKRGYVSHSHIDIASVHKLIANVFALPYPNVEVANAALPFDMFSETPDYTPYTYAKRSFLAVCGADATMAEQRLTASWDFDDPDAQPGLDQQVMRWLAHRQLETLPPALEAQIVRREQARERRRHDDD